jgi:hypothetical protein
MRTLDDDHVIISSLAQPAVEILELRKGRFAGRISLPEGENVTDVERMEDGNFVVLTTSSLNRYSIGSCAKESDRPLRTVAHKLKSSLGL